MAPPASTVARSRAHGRKVTENSAAEEVLAALRWGAADPRRAEARRLVSTLAENAGSVLPLLGRDPGLLEDVLARPLDLDEPPEAVHRAFASATGALDATGGGEGSATETGGGGAVVGAEAGGVSVGATTVAAVVVGVVGPGGLGPNVCVAAIATTARVTTLPAINAIRVRDDRAGAGGAPGGRETSGVDETSGDRTPNAAVVLRLFEETKKRGLLVGKGGLFGNVFRVAPALNVSAGDVDEALKIMRESFAAIHA